MPSAAVGTGRSRWRAVAKRMVAGAAVLVLALAAVVYWVEAEKELRVLCGLTHVGATAAEIDRLYATASLLRVRADTGAAGVTLHVASRHNLGLSACTVAMSDGAVARADHRERVRLGRALPNVPLAFEIVGALTLLALAGGAAALAAERARVRWVGGLVALAAFCLGAARLLGG